MLKNRLFPLVLLVICMCFLFAGCTININIGNPTQDAAEDTDSKTIFDNFVNSGNQTTVYQSRATIYISSAESNSVSATDLMDSKQLTETYAVILNSQTIQNKIQEEYPNVECEFTLEPINETELFYIIATSENPKKLNDVCNLATSLFCENITNIAEGVSCKVVDLAVNAQLVG